MHKYRRLMRYALREWPTLLLILVPGLIASMVTALQPWPMKILVDYAVGSAAVPRPLAAILEWLHPSFPPMVLVGVAAVASLGLFALNSALDAVLTWARAAAGQR